MAGTQGEAIEAIPMGTAVEPAANATALVMPTAVATPVAGPIAMAVPLSQTMERVLGPHDVISVQQTPRGCLQECMGCSARSEFKLYAGFNETMPGLDTILPGAPKVKDPNQLAHMLEESPFCPDRCFWSGMRKFSIPIKVPDENGEVMMYNEKAFSLPTHCIVHGENGDLVIPCCCYLPTLKTYTADKTYVGKSKYVCDQYLFVPKLAIYDADNNPQFMIRPDTCCAGCCPVCDGGGKGSNCIFMPFYIRNFATLDKIPSAVPGMDAQIRNVWPGFKREICTSADNYFVVFPAGTTSNTKGALLGATTLLDFTVFEEKNGGCLFVSW